MSTRVPVAAAGLQFPPETAQTPPAGGAAYYRARWPLVRRGPARCSCRNDRTHSAAPRRRGKRILAYPQYGAYTYCARRPEYSAAPALVRPWRVSPIGEPPEPPAPQTHRTLRTHPRLRTSCHIRDTRVATIINLRVPRPRYGPVPRVPSGAPVAPAALAAASRWGPTPPERPAD